MFRALCRRESSNWYTQIVRIQDPARRAGNFTFDKGWRNVDSNNEVGSGKGQNPTVSAVNYPLRDHAGVQNA